MANEITTTETIKVTQQLCTDYIKSQNTNLTDGEFAQYAAVATTLNLNPFLHEIYPIKFNGKMTLVTGYQVYIRRAEEFPQYDGYETEFAGSGKELSCTCLVYRKDRNHPIKATVFISEYSQNNSMWNSKPHVMLEKVAIGTAFRRAFPSEFKGMPYASEEVYQETASERLEREGHVEVKVEPPTEDEKKTTFINAMKKMKSDAPDIYKRVLEENKIEKIDDVEESKRKAIYKAVYNAIVEKKKAETEE